MLTLCASNRNLVKTKLDAMCRLQPTGLVVIPLQIYRYSIPKPNRGDNPYHYQQYKRAQYDCRVVKLHELLHQLLRHIRETQGYPIAGDPAGVTVQTPHPRQDDESGNDEGGEDILDEGHPEAGYVAFWGP